MRKIDRIAPIIILASNIYFLPLTIYILFTGGGPMGFAYLALPFCILINLFIIPTILFYNRNSSVEKPIIANRIGAIYIISFLVIFTIIINRS